LVNNEQLDEAVAYLRTALKYQPGSQRYLVRIAEIYLRQEKFSEAAAIADKIAKTADEPEIKAQAENLTAQLRQRQEISAANETSRKKYEAALAEANKNGGQPVLIHRGSGEKTQPTVESAKAAEDGKMLAVNQSLTKPQASEKQIIGQIQKVECKGKTIAFTIKTDNETFTLASKDFETLTLTAHVADAENAQVGCGENISGLNSVLTYKPTADVKSPNRGELVSIDFVPKNFRFMDTAVETNDEVAIVSVDADAPPAKPQDFEAQRRAAMMQGIKNALRQPQTGEKRQIGTIEKVECGNKGMFFLFKSGTQILKLTAVSQSIQMRAYTPDVEQLQFGCGMKQVDIPAVFTYKESSDAKAKTAGELVALEFVPKSFTLDE
jgi:hypothetical protein